MFNLSYRDYATSGLLNALVQNYLNKEPAIKPYYSYFPDLNGFEQVLATQAYSELNREILYAILHRQAHSVSNTSNYSLKNIEQLKHKNTYTITTGHQLCLFTGPLYFIYKIFSAINLAEELKKQFPDSNFVPVYWMASEDHDFEEVNHFHVFGKKIVWESLQNGAVGDFNTDELKTLFTLIQEVFGKSENAGKLLTLFESAYLNNASLADATRHLVNALFGEYGLVIVDGNDAEFKEQFKDIIREDIFLNTSAAKINESNSELSALGFDIQVKPRPINCFYLQKGIRGRIEFQNERFHVVGTELSFTKEEMDALIEHEPESISPNVVLRPLYQQRILPNLAYVGGPGELAYWLQFKKMFDRYNIVFPVLIPRNFVTVVEKQVKEKINKLGFDVADFFKSEEELVKLFLTQSEATFELEQEKAQLTAVYDEILNKINSIDKSLSGTVSAELQKTINGLHNLIAKVNKALKQRSEQEINQIKSLKQKLFPTGIPQERYDNFSQYAIKYGDHFLKEIKQNASPFLFKALVLTEN